MWICCHLQVLWYSTHAPASCIYCSLSRALAGLSPACLVRSLRQSPRGFHQTTLPCQIITTSLLLLLHFARFGHKKRSRLRHVRLSSTATYLVYLTANTQSCLSYDNFRTIVSFNAAKVRILFESSKYFSKFFLGYFDIPYK